MIIHQYENERFPQTNKDQTIGGEFIPKGYVNASLMCKNWGKQVKAFMRQKRTKLYIESLEKGINKVRFHNGTVQDNTKTLEELRETVEDWTKVAISLTEKNNVSNDYRGVWVHYELAIELAGWLNVEFKIWGNRVLRLVIEGETQGLVWDNAQAKLQWEWLRTQSKLSRRKFTDCLKEHIIKTKGEKYYNSPASAKEFAKYTAIAQSKLTGFPSFNGNRDNCSEDQLKILETFELMFCMTFTSMYPDISFDEIFLRVLNKVKK